METIPEPGQAERLLKIVPSLACFSTAMFPVPSKPFAPVLEWSHQFAVDELSNPFLHLPSITIV